MDVSLWRFKRSDFGHRFKKVPQDTASQLRRFLPRVPQQLGSCDLASFGHQRFWALPAESASPGPSPSLIGQYEYSKSRAAPRNSKKHSGFRCSLWGPEIPIVSHFKVSFLHLIFLGRSGLWSLKGTGYSGLGSKLISQTFPSYPLSTLLVWLLAVSPAPISVWHVVDT